MFARPRIVALIGALALIGPTLVVVAPPAHAQVQDPIQCGGDGLLGAANRSVESTPTAHYASVQLFFLGADGQETGSDDLELVGNRDSITTTVPQGSKEAVIVNDPVPLSDDPIQIKIAPETTDSVTAASDNLVGLTVTLRATVERSSDDHALELCGEIRVRVTAT